MEEAALSPGVEVMEAPETTMPGEPDGSRREAQPWEWQLGLGCEQREGCTGKGRRVQVVWICSLLSTHSGPLLLVWG